MNAPTTRAGWIVAALTLAYCGLGLWLGAGYDTGRDVAAAWAIAHDGARPLIGPVFAGQVHLGPAWFYLLAAALAVWPGWLAPALVTAIVASLQLPLAYATGKRLADRQLGLFWVCALLLPGWTSFEQVGFSCTNLVRVSVLAALYCLVRARQTPAAHWWFAAGLASALAIHAHPSAAWVAGIVLVTALVWPGSFTRVVRERVAALVLAAIGIALPFLPMLASAQDLLAPTAATATANVAFDNLSRVPALARSILAGGAYTVFATLDGLGDTRGRIAAAIASVLVIIGGIAGLLGAVRGVRPALLGLVLTVAGLLFVALVRPVTPLYMAYSVGAVLALLVATGWRIMARVVGGVAGRAVTAMFAGIAIATFAWVGASQVGAMARGGGQVDSPRLANITTSPATAVPPTDVWLPAKDVDALGKALCAAPGAVHGALPYLLDVHYALPVRMHCPASFGVFDARGALATSRLALAEGRWQELGAVPDQRIGGIGLAPVSAVIAAPAVRDLPRADAYPPHAYATGLPLSVEFSFELPTGQYVVASNARVAWMPQWETTARCNGVPARLASADLVTRVYACATPGAPAQWVVSARAQDASHVEFVAFAPRLVAGVPR